MDEAKVGRHAPKVEKNARPIIVVIEILVA